MKILLLSQFFSTTRGGGEYVFSLMTKKLAENDHKVWIITNRIEDENYDTHENINIIFVPPTLKYKGGLPPGFLDNLRYLIHAFSAGFKIIKKEQIDLIHSNNFAPALAGSILSYFTSMPHITTIHDIFSLCGKNYWKRWGRQNNVSKINVMFAPFFERLLVKLKQDCIHTVSEATKDDLLQFGTKKPIYVIHNALTDSGTYTIANPNKFQFVCVGRLVFYKNIEIIIKAINIARKSEPKVKLIIVGGGPQRKILEDLTKKLDLQNNIEFTGYVTVEEKTKLIGTSNALLFPTLCEGFGLVILEAFSQNRAVLVSNIRPMSDIVTDGKTGYLLDPHDENEWAKKILSLVSNPDVATVMGKKGYEVLQSKYNSDLLYQKVIKMYSDILAKR